MRSTSLLSRRSAVLAAAGVILLPLGAAQATAAPPRAAAAPRAPLAVPPAHGIGLVPSAQPRVTARTGLATARRLGAAIGAGVAVPASADLTAYAPVPGDQGPVGSCVAWSLAYTMSGWYSNYQRHTGQPFAPMYVYSQINGGRDAGASTPAAWSVLETQGIAEQKVYPQGNYDWWDKPTAAEIANAALHKGTSHTYLFVGDNQGVTAQTALQAALAGGRPVEIGIPVHSGFTGMSPGNAVWHLSDTSGKSLLGYHAIVAMGYDQTGLRIENSWGSRWGAAGYATLSWDFVNRYVMEASVGTGFAGATPPPLVTTPPRVSTLSRPTVAAGAGVPVTVTGAGMSTVDKSSAAAVRLVSTADPAVVANAPVTAQAGSTLTVAVPALPAGTYRVVVTGSGGSSAPNGTADVLTAVTPYAVTVAPGAVAGANGRTRLPLTGAGFGTTAAQFAANKVTATVNAAPAALTWVSDTRLTVAVPAGLPGTPVAVTLLHSGVPGPVNSAARYSAVITTSTAPAGPSGGGWATVLTGTGLARSGGWVLVDSTGRVAATLPTLAAGTTPAAGSGGVLVGSADVRVWLPASPTGRPGVFSLAFTPDQAAYRGATAAFTAAAAVVYTDAG